MSDILSGLPLQADPNLLVGLGTSDDAAVYRLTDDIAVISTVDFITPPVDDPWWFGQIAAANALSDVYAMGGRPITALNLVMFPIKQLDPSVLKEILRGAAEKLAEAGASLAGGHSVDDEEPKFGLCVSGVVHPDRIWTNAGALPGDAVILTKPLGSGVLFNAVRAGRWPLASLLADVLPVVAALNATAATVAADFTVHAATDVTGFGIAGHCHELAMGAGVRVVLQHAALPIYDGALEMYAAGQTTGSNPANQALVADTLHIEATLDQPQQQILVDPQTSGGLLLAVPQAQAAELVLALHAAGVADAVQIGSVQAGAPAVVVR